MEFEGHDRAINAGREVGFFLGYMAFFTMFYLILSFLGKMPFSIAPEDYLLMILTVFVWGKVVAKVVRHVKG